MSDNHPDYSSNIRSFCSLRDKKGVEALSLAPLSSWEKLELEQCWLFSLFSGCLQVARLEGFEPTTLGSEDRCSVR